MATGQFVEAFSALEEALNLAVQSGERFYEAELLRLKGEFQSITQETSCCAEREFLSSLDTSKLQSARLFTLRTVASLGRLWLREGKRQQARELIVATIAEGQCLAHTADYAALVRLQSE